jgi:hypothetical protein
MVHRFFILFLSVIGLYAISVPIISHRGNAESSSPNYVIWADVLSSGGTDDGTSVNYGLQDSMGEDLIWSATNTSASYGIKAGFRELYPDQFLTLSLGSAAIDLGTITDATTGSASHTVTMDTNAINGFVLTVSGLTLTSGANTIDAIGAVAAVSTPGTEQFGLNFVDNATPDIGANPTGTAPLGSANGQYALADSFAFLSGDTVASSTTDISSTIFTASYIANVSAATPVGDYQTTLTYAATANY